MRRISFKIVKGITSSSRDKSQSKWMADCENYENVIEWDKSYILSFYCTKETKLQTFQFKLLHRRIATNDNIYKIGITCTFCEQKRKPDSSLLGLCIRSDLLAKHPTLIDTASDKATELFFDPTNLPGTS